MVIISNFDISLSISKNVGRSNFFFLLFQIKAKNIQHALDRKII